MTFAWTSPHSHMTQREPNRCYVSISWCTRIVCASACLVRGWSSLLKTVWTPQCGLTSTGSNCQFWFNLFMSHLRQFSSTWDAPLWLKQYWGDSVVVVGRQICLQSCLMYLLRIKKILLLSSVLPHTPWVSVLQWESDPCCSERVLSLLYTITEVCTVITSAIRNKRHIYTKYRVYFASYIDLSFFSFSWNNKTWDVNDNGYTVIQDKRKTNIQYKTMKVHILVNIRETKA